jgi:hypothetical protein
VGAGPRATIDLIGSVEFLRSRPSCMTRLAIILVFWTTAATAAHAQTVATRHDLDRDRSAIYVVTKRSGLLSFLGHDHAILAHEWEGSICATGDAVPRGHGRIVVQTAFLEIDPDSARALAGLGRGPSADQRRKLQQTMLDEAHLAAASAPTITIDVEQIVLAGEDPTARARLTIRNRMRDVTFPMATSRSGDTIRIAGVLRVAQSDFGIRPESVAGVVRVADTVAIHFDLIAVDTRTSCQ